MAADNRKPRDRAADVERLAAQLFAGLVAGPRGQAKTATTYATDALALAREFYRVADEPTDQPKG